MASIVACAILIAAAAMIYFSPYRTCVRATVAQDRASGIDGPFETTSAQKICARR